MLPFVFLALRDRDLSAIWAGAFMTWGLCAILLIAIKIRGAVVPLDPNGRPWWIHTSAGALMATVFLLILVNTTDRDRYWTILGDGGTILLALCLTSIAAGMLAILLAPKKRTN